MHCNFANSQLASFYASVTQVNISQNSLKAQHWSKVSIIPNQHSKHKYVFQSYFHCLGRFCSHLRWSSSDRKGNFSPSSNLEHVSFSNPEQFVWLQGFVGCDGQPQPGIFVQKPTYVGNDITLGDCQNYCNSQPRACVVSRSCCLAITVI